MQNYLKVGLGFAVILAGAIFLTRWLSMKEQKALDNEDFASRIFSAVESVKTEYYKRFEQQAADFQTKKASARQVVSSGGTGTARPATRQDSMGCCAEADSLRLVAAAFARTDSATFTMKDSARISVRHIPNLGTLESIFEILYRPPPREFDSTVVNRSRYVAVGEQQVGWATAAVIEVAAAAVLAFEIIRFLITGKP